MAPGCVEAPTPPQESFWALTAQEWPWGPCLLQMRRVILGQYTHGRTRYARTQQRYGHPQDSP
jgi:hypothetical protein